MSDFYGMIIRMHKKWYYCIEDIRKTTAEEDISAELLEHLDHIAQAWNFYFTKQLPEYTSLAEEVITTIEKASKETYEQLYTALYESLWAIFRIGQKEQYQLDERFMNASPFAYSFAISDVRMESYINTRVWELIRDVDTTTQKQIQTIISAWQSSWATLEEVAQTIYTTFSQYTEARSYLIARMELRTALEFGRKAQFEEDAQIVWVEWWKKSYDQDDDAVRETHSQASEAWWIPANQPFPWVEKQRPPFDFGCRCTATYRLRHPDETQIFTP
jgi:hypothetical protein